MKRFAALLSLSLSLTSAYSQDTAITLSPGMFTGVQEIYISTMDGWIFKEGNDTGWARKDIDITGWKKLTPAQLSAKQADKNGRLEGWLRFRFNLNDDFKNLPLGLRYLGWGASDIYIDGALVKSFGNTGADGLAFKEYNPLYRLPFFPGLQPGVEHVVAMHFVDYVSPFPPFKLKSNANLHALLLFTGPKYYALDLISIGEAGVFQTLWLSVTTIAALLLCFLAFLNPREKNLRLFALCSSLIALAIYFNNLYYNNGNSFIKFSYYYYCWRSFIVASNAVSVVIVAQVFKQKAPVKLKTFIVAYLLINVVAVLIANDLLLAIGSLLPIFVYTYFIISSWKTLKGAQWAIFGGLFVALGLQLIWATLFYKYRGDFFPNVLLIASALVLSFPLSLLIYVALRFREIISEVRQQAQKVVELSEEKKEQALKQQKILEEEVAKQTIELRTSFENLKSTQAQLIQSEKMASLGELTAGIAHEIQNPLNFVNNFSDVNKELLQELKQEATKGNMDDVKAIADNVISNEEKINHHGKRADAIVKGMLQHSGQSLGIKEATDINALCDEYFRLSFHGFRAKDKSLSPEVSGRQAGFNATMKTAFDESIGKINIVPQDIGRVVLNLLNNAFYAVSAKASDLGKSLPGKLATADNRYEPTVTITTKKTGQQVLISVKDNGNGIPQRIIDKIFQPFFTTKPTGQGTGLGLSLSYDIIKAHGGEIKMKSKEGESAEFIILMPGSA